MRRGEGGGGEEEEGGKLSLLAGVKTEKGEGEKKGIC